MSTRATEAHRSAPPHLLTREAVGPAVVNGRRGHIEPDDEGYPAVHYRGAAGAAPPPAWDVHYQDHRGLHHWILFLCLTLTLVPLACLIAGMLA